MLEKQRKVASNKRACMLLVVGVGLLLGVAFVSMLASLRHEDTASSTPTAFATSTSALLGKVVAGRTAASPTVPPAKALAEGTAASPTVPPAKALAGKQVQCIYVDDTTIYAGTQGGAGMYRSTDNGANWQEYGTGLGTQDVLAIVKRDSYLLAGTWGGGVYQIASGGTSWTQLGSLPADYDFGRSMAVGSSYTYAAESQGRVYRLRSGSSSWQEIDSLPWVRYTKFLFVDAYDNLYAGVTSLGVYKYTSGNVWQSEGDLGGRDALAMDYGPDGALWVGTSDGVYRWRTGQPLSGTSGWDVTALKHNPQHTDELFVGLRTGQVYRYRQSTGGWDAVNLGITGQARVWSLGCATGEPQRLFVGASDGLYYTDIEHATSNPR